MQKIGFCAERLQPLGWQIFQESLNNAARRTFLKMQSALFFVVAIVG
jgi:hypothetical protein